MLVGELTEMGIQAKLDSFGYVYASIPAAPGFEKGARHRLYRPYGYR